MNRTAQTRLHRPGLTVAELVVAGVLLSAGITVVTKMANFDRVLQQRESRYRFASAELANQMSSLQHLAPEKVAVFLQQLAPSPEAEERLPGCDLNGTFEEDSLGIRVQLTLSWERIGDNRPLGLVGWIVRNSTAESGIAASEPDTPSNSRIPRTHVAEAE